MILGEEDKENLVLELYYEKNHTYRDIAKELRISPNQIREIIRKHEEKNDTIANKKKELSLSSKAYKLFSKGRTSVEVAIMLDIPEAQVTQFRMEYWKLIGQDKLATLYTILGDRIFSFFKLYKELIIKRGMTIERVANIVEIALDKLPYMETLYEQAKNETDRLRGKRDYLENRIRTLAQEYRRMVTLPSSSYYYVNDRKTSFPSQPASLPYWPTEYPDLSNEYRNEQEKLRKKKEIGEVDEGRYR